MKYFGWAVAWVVIIGLLWFAKPDKTIEDVSLWAPEVADTVRATEDAARQSVIAEQEQPSERSAGPVMGAKPSKPTPKADSTPF